MAGEWRCSSCGQHNNEPRPKCVRCSAQFTAEQVAKNAAGRALYRPHYVRPQPTFDLIPEDDLNSICATLGDIFKGDEITREQEETIDAARMLLRQLYTMNRALRLGDVACYTITDKGREMLKGRE